MNCREFTATISLEFTRPPRTLQNMFSQSNDREHSSI